MSIPFRKIKQNIESEQYIYSEYEYCRAISPNIFVLVSAGVDSMFLLDFMSRCKIRFDVIHFVHGIRSADQSLADLALIHNTVTKLNKTRSEHDQITVRVGYGEGLSEGGNVESRAHKQRWDFVNEQRNRINREYLESDYVKEKRKETHEYVDYEIHNHAPGILAITAHHLNDAVETALMKLMRGCPHDQLVLTEKRYLHQEATRFRPLIQVPKSTILKMAQVRNLKWNEDITNEDNVSERNWLRNVIIPQLLERRNIYKSMAPALDVHC